MAPKLHIIHISDVRAGDWAEEPKDRADRVIQALKDCNIRVHEDFDYMVLGGNNTVNREDRQFESAKELILALAGILTKQENRSNRVLITPGPCDVSARGEPLRFDAFNRFTDSVHAALGGLPSGERVATTPGCDWWKLRVMKDLTLVGMHIEPLREDSHEQFACLEQTLRGIVSEHPMQSVYARDHRPVLMACDTYPSALLEEPPVAAAGRLLSQRFLALGKHLYLCFTDGSLPVIPPQPFRSAEFYAFGKHRVHGGPKKVAGIGLLRIEMASAHVNLEFTPLLVNDTPRAESRAYQIPRDKLPSLSDVFNPYMRKLEALITQHQEPRIVVISGIPGCGARELLQSLNEELFIQLSTGRYRKLSHHLPSDPSMMCQSFTDLRKRISDLRNHGDQPMVLLTDPASVPASVKNQEDWVREFMKEMDVFPSDPFGWVLYFPNPMRQVMHRSRDYITNLWIEPLAGTDHDIVGRVYESEFPLPKLSYLRALTGGFVGFDLALCDFAKNRFNRFSGAECLAPHIEKQLFNEALGPIPPSERLRDHLEEFAEWLETQSSGNRILDMICETMVKERIREKLLDGGKVESIMIGAPITAVSQTTIEMLRQAKVLANDDRLQLTIPFLVAQVEFKYRFHLAFPGALIERAKELHNALVASGCDVYLYSEPNSQDLTRDWQETEQQSIREADGFVLLYHSAGQSDQFSSNLFTECRFANDLGKARLIVLLEEIKSHLPEPIRNWNHVIPPGAWPQDAAARIMRHFRSHFRVRARGKMRVE
jgi:hypothetical protein